MSSNIERKKEEDHDDRIRQNRNELDQASNEVVSPEDRIQQKIRKLKQQSKHDSTLCASSTPSQPFLENERATGGTVSNLSLRSLRIKAADAYEMKIPDSNAVVEPKENQNIDAMQAQQSLRAKNKGFQRNRLSDTQNMKTDVKTEASDVKRSSSLTRNESIQIAEDLHEITHTGDIGDEPYKSSTPSDNSGLNRTLNENDSLPFANIVSMNEVILMHDVTDERSLYTGNLVRDQFSSVTNERKPIMCASVPWLTKGRLVIFLLCVVIAGLGSYFFVSNGDKGGDTTAVPSGSIEEELLPTIYSAVVSSLPTSHPTSSSAPTSTWVQVGSDFDGEASKQLGRLVSVSSNGNRFCAKSGDGLQFFDWTSDGIGQWSALELKDNILSDFTSVKSLSLSADGSYLIVGDPNTDRITKNQNVVVEVIYSIGIAIVLRFRKDEKKWEKMGQSLEGQENNDYFGQSVDINRGGENIVVGADGGKYVKVFKWDSDARNNKWTKQYNITNSTLTSFGSSLSIAAISSKMVIGAYQADTSYGTRSGSAHVYNFNDGSLIQSIEGDTVNDFFGFAVSMSSNGKRVAIGSRQNYVKIFTFIDNVRYSQVGATITGVEDSLFGYSVGLSEDGDWVAIGARKSNEGGYFIGKTDIYFITPTNWTWIAMLTGVDEDDQFGRSVAISDGGKRVFIGGDGGSEKNGFVRVYENTQV